MPISALSTPSRISGGEYVSAAPASAPLRTPARVSGGEYDTPTVPSAPLPPAPPYHPSIAERVGGAALGVAIGFMFMMAIPAAIVGALWGHIKDTVAPQPEEPPRPLPPVTPTRVSGGEW